MESRFYFKNFQRFWDYYSQIWVRDDNVLYDRGGLPPKQDVIVCIKDSIDQWYGELRKMMTKIIVSDDEAMVNNLVMLQLGVGKLEDFEVEEAKQYVYNLPMQGFKIGVERYFGKVDSFYGRHPVGVILEKYLAFRRPVDCTFRYENGLIQITQGFCFKYYYWHECDKGTESHEIFKEDYEHELSRLEEKKAYMMPTNMTLGLDEELLEQLKRYYKRTWGKAVARSAT